MTRNTRRSGGGIRPATAAGPATAVLPALALLATLVTAGCGGHAAAADHRPGANGHGRTGSAAPTGTAVPPSPTVVPSAVAAHQVVFHGARDSGEVALTFDADMTPRMLRDLQTGVTSSAFDDRIITELQQTGTPATLFLTGMWIQKYPDATRTISANPLFEVGSHSYQHSAYALPCYGLPSITPAAVPGDIGHAEQLLADGTSKHTAYFRFPGGCYTASIVADVYAAGLIPIQWDDISGDAFGHDPAAITRQALSQAHGGSIIVMHLNGAPNAPMTSTALPGIIAGVKAKGLRPVLLSQLLAAP